MQGLPLLVSEENKKKVKRNKYYLLEIQTKNEEKVNQNLFLPGQTNKRKVQKNIFLSRQTERQIDKQKVTNNLFLSHLCFSPRVWVSIKATTKEKLKRTFNCGKKGSIINGLISQMMLQGQTWYLV